MNKYFSVLLVLLLVTFLFFLFPPDLIWSKEVLYTLCDDQIYHSFDGGASWDGLYIESDINLHYNSMAFDDNNHIIYVASQTALLKSPDSGKSWMKCYPSGKQDSMNLIALSSDDPAAIYAVTPVNLYVSRDRAKSWTPKTLPQRNIYFIAASSDHNIVYTAGGKRIYKSTDNGSTWKSINSNLSSHAFVRDMAVNPADCNEIYLSTTVGLYRSTDGGKRWWEKKITQKEWIKTTELYFHPRNPQIQYMLSVDEKEGGASYLRKSKDGGNQWYTIASMDEIRVFAINPLNSENVFYLGYRSAETQGIEGLFKNIYESRDGGKSWKELQGILPGTENLKKMYVRPW